MKLRIVFILLFTTALLSCSAPVEYTLVNTLRMTNNSQNRIYVSLITQGNRRESFGVVGPNGSASIGFSPAKFEKEVSITWGENQLEKSHAVKFSIEGVHALSEPISELNFVYLGNGLWEMLVFGSNNQTLLRLSSKEV